MRPRPHRFWAADQTAQLLLIAVPGGIEDYFLEISTASADEGRHRIGGAAGSASSTDEPYRTSRPAPHGHRKRGADLAQQPFRGQKLRQQPPGYARPAATILHRAWSVAVEVGFEPTEDLCLHTLSSTAHHRSPASANVRDQRERDQANTGERRRTAVNETKTETRRDLLSPGGRAAAEQA